LLLSKTNCWFPLTLLGQFYTAWSIFFWPFLKKKSNLTRSLFSIFVFFSTLHGYKNKTEQGIHQEETTAQIGVYHSINNSEINENIKNKEPVINLIFLSTQLTIFVNRKPNLLLKNLFSFPLKTQILHVHADSTLYFTRKSYSKITCRQHVRVSHLWIGIYHLDPYFLLKVFLSN